ncbi:MAG: type III secretion T3S chaperone [Verrucomicrobia bacterium]|nr:type III secretion T3S chaperone [Verrucomicrobiota bacterium]
MNNPLNYPLEQLVTIKKNRFDQAVKILEEKKALLDKANAKLYDLTRERDETLQHKVAKLNQLRSELDAGTTTDKIQQMKAYLKIVDEKLAEREKKVADQKKVVEAAEKQVEVATEEMYQRKKDLEKLEIHKKEWEKEVKYWTEQKESLEQDDQGSATYNLRKKEAEMRKKARENHE